MMLNALEATASRYRWEWKLLLLGTLVMIGGLAHGGSAVPSADSHRLTAEMRQMALIEARITALAGDIPGAMAIYRQLRRAAPADREIQTTLVAFLIEHDYQAAAQGELTRMLRSTPEDPDLLRLQARLFFARQQFGRANAIYDRLTAAMPDDPQLWSDAAAARLGDARWADALDAYSRAQELGPENRDVSRAIHDIIRQYGPRLDGGWQRYHQIADDTIIDTTTVSLAQPLSEATRLLVDVRHLGISRPRQPFADSVNENISDLLVGLRRQINPQWSARLDIGGHTGTSTDTSVGIGGTYASADGLRLTGVFQKNRPWYDPPDAAELGGQYDHLDLSLGWDRGRRAALSLQAQSWWYRLDGTGDYGDQQALSGTLTYRLWLDPELNLGYNYYHAWFDYADTDRPVAMIEDQGWHTLYGSFTHRPTDQYAWGLFAGLRRDHVRHIDGWFLSPSVTLRLGNRLTLDGAYQVASESATAVGGKTQTFRVDARFNF